MTGDLKQLLADKEARDEKEAEAARSRARYAAWAHGFWEKLGEWIMGLDPKSSWRPWYDAETLRVQQNKARLYIAAHLRGDREAAEMQAAGLVIPRRKHNQDKLLFCLELLYGEAEAARRYRDIIDPKWRYREREKPLGKGESALSRVVPNHWAGKV